MPTACRECRIRKRKCIINKLGASCNLCVGRRLDCTAAFTFHQSHSLLAPTATTVEAVSLHTSPTFSTSPEVTPYSGIHVASDGDEGMPSEALRDELVDLYFDLIHDKQHALFHRDSLKAQQKSGEAPNYLIFAIMAMAARFSTDPYFDHIKIWERGRDWAQRSKLSFEARPIAVSLAAVQGCALLGNLAFIEGNSAVESLYGAQAIRMVQLLGLPKRLSTNLVQREVEIRVWWTTWMMDTWTSTSVGIPRQLCADPGYDLPMEETSFGELVTNPAPADNLRHEEASSAVNPGSGLWAQMIPLTTIMGEIHALNKLAISPLHDDHDIIGQVGQLSSKLNYWLYCLPPSLRNSARNLQIYEERGFGRTFAALHFGYHYHAQLLYYQFLRYTGRDRYHRASPGRSHDWANDLLIKYAAECKKHASDLSRLMWTTNTTPGLECLWPINGHLLVIASTVHLHTLLFEENELLLADAKTMLEHNFMMLQQLQTYWPCLEFSTSRLRAFHRACQDSMDESFDMNDWMLHFLQEYALPVSDRFRGSHTGHDAAQNSWSRPQGTELYRELLGDAPFTADLGDILQWPV